MTVWNPTKRCDEKNTKSTGSQGPKGNFTMSSTEETTPIIIGDGEETTPSLSVSSISPKKKGKKRKTGQKTN